MEAVGESLSPSRAVIEKLAEVKSVDPADLEPPLATVIDTDALDRLFATRTETTGQVTFQYREYDVTVTSDGDVTIRSSNKIG